MRKKKRQNALKKRKITPTPSTPTPLRTSQIIAISDAISALFSTDLEATLVVISLALGKFISLRFQIGTIAMLLFRHLRLGV